MTDPLLPKNLNIFQLFDGAFSALIHNALRVRPHLKSMGISQWTEVVGTRRYCQYAKELRLPQQ